jgi:hypothetical protein
MARALRYAHGMKTFWTRLWGASLLLVAYEATTAAVNNSVQGGHGDEEALLTLGFILIAAVVGAVVGLMRDRPALMPSSTVGAMLLAGLAPILVALVAVLVSPATEQVGRPYFCSEFFRSTHHSPKICELCSPGGCGG